MAGLNENHRRCLQVACSHIDEHLSRVEAMLESAANAAFPRYVDDLLPTQKRVVRDYFAHIRAQLLALIERFGMAPEPAETTVSWAGRTTLIYLRDVIADMGPERLRGYGALDAETGAELQALIAEVDQTLARVMTYLGQHHGRDPQERLARLESEGRLELSAVKTLGRILSEHGLVQFRPTLESILDALETSCLEIAIFGRVSSGKSSLLNHIVGMPVLPVGVTPVTAVPTRITAGSKPECVVSFAEGSPRQISIQEIPLYASEEGNPGNRRHVTALQVRLPSPRLREGIVFIDTPGIGSLATQGEAESIAYLPRCDLGVVLLDSAAALNAEDLGLLRLLYEAGIPAQVLLSKCDLLASADRDRMVRYIEEQLQRQAGLSLPVYPVSTVGAEEVLLETWFEQEIRPLYEEQQSLIQASIRRKAGLLLEGLRTALTERLAAEVGAERREPLHGSNRADPSPCGRPRADRSLPAPEHAEALEQALRQAALRMKNAEARARSVSSELLALEEKLRAEVAAGVVELWLRNGRHSVSLGDEIADLVARWLDQHSRALAAEINALRTELIGLLAATHSMRSRVPGRQELIAGLVPEEPVPLPELYGLPVPDLAPLRAALQTQSPITGLWRSGWFRRGADRRIQERLHEPLHEALVHHARRLQEWTRDSVARLTDAFQEQEATYREILHPSSIAAASEKPEGRDRIVSDLRELDQLAAGALQAAAEDAPGVAATPTAADGS
jgi:GTP-binding protein EngB required for normal cell division